MDRTTSIEELQLIKQAIISYFLEEPEVKKEKTSQVIDWIGHKLCISNYKFYALEIKAIIETMIKENQLIEKSGILQINTQCQLKSEKSLSKIQYEIYPIRERRLYVYQP